MTNCKSLLLFLSLFCLLLRLPAQQPGELPWLKPEPAKKQALLAAIESRYKKDVEELSGKHKKQLAEIFKERYEIVKTAIEGEETITDSRINAYLSSLVAEIFKANPSLPASEIRVLFSNDVVVNACSMGEGTILFNTGLFHRLKSESQAVFTICHELAHYLLDHGNNSIRSYVNTVYSDSFQKELKSIQQSEFKQNQQLISLAVNFTFRNRRHSRQHEAAADSMAVELMKNTGYNLQGALECLAILDSSAKMKYDSPLRLQERFNFSGQPFRKRWIDSDVMRFTSEDETAADSILADSLKTHPDCSTRIERLKPFIKARQQPGARDFKVSEATFKQLVQQFDYELLEHLFKKKEVSKCLFLTLQMLNTHPSDPYLHTMTGRCLNEIYRRQKAHELNRFVDLPADTYNAEYNQLLHLIQNLRLTEIAALSFYYLQQQEAGCAAYKPFGSVFEEAKKHFTN
ncbi:MAG TPA: M48 family metallopeptidase [Flavisolibacter sp.]|nr:M48 family metallopeptidase [Flavisolibacter sp.]